MTSANFTLILQISLIVSSSFIAHINCGRGEKETTPRPRQPKVLKNDKPENTKTLDSPERTRILEGVKGLSNGEGDKEDEHQTSTGSWTWTVVSIILGVALILSCCCNLYLLGREEENSELETVSVADPGWVAGGPIVGRTKSVQKEFHEVPKDSFTIDENSPLRPGTFGMTCMGTLTIDGSEEQVVVKVIDKSSAVKGLLHEIKMLAYLGKHQNITELKGVYTAELKEGRVLVFLELGELGTLQSYLRGVKSQLPEVDGEKAELDQILISDMGRWSRDIASAMEYISSKYVVHCDIATRNVLLASDKQAKLFDFSLSRRPFEGHGRIETDALRRHSMAPETLKRWEFTDKSDVWSFGIFLWEIYTLGDEPGLDWAVDFPAKLGKGLRLRKPTYNINDIYSVMLRCWKLNPARRSTFSELVSILGGNLTRDGEITDGEVTMTTPV